MKNNEPSIERDIHIDIPAHQILISFNEDDQANAFYNWWNEIGFSLYMEYWKRWENY